MKKYLLGSLVLCASTCLNGAIVYSEDFDFAGSPLQPLSASGWMATTHFDGETRDMSNSTSDTDQDGWTTYASLTTVGTDDLAFFGSFQQVAPYLVYTTEVAALNLSAATVTSIQWTASARTVNFTPSNDVYRAAVQIGGVWYASETGVVVSTTDAAAPQSGSISFNVDAGNWLSISDPSLMLGSANANPLAGLIEAAGIFVEEPRPGSQRLHSFEILGETAVIPEPATISVLALAAVLFALLTRGKGVRRFRC